MNVSEPFYLSTVFARTFIVFGALIIGVRVFGKRNVGEMNLLDLAMILLIGNAIQNAITYGSGQLWVGVVAAATLLILDQLLGKLFTRYPTIEDIIIGDPTILLMDGVFDHQEMMRQGITVDKVQMAARGRGITDLDEIHLAVLEENGEISIIPNKKKPPS